MGARPAALFLAALILVLGIGGGLVSRSRATAEVETEPASLAAADEPARTDPPLAAAEATEERAHRRPPPRSDAAARAVATAPPDEAFVPAPDSVWLEGRVVFPPGTPADERVRVVARGIAFAGPSSPKRHVVDVARDGSFRVAVVQGAQRALVQLESRYFLWPEVVRVDLASLSGPLVIEPRLGGRLAGRVRLPEGAPGTGFEGVVLRVGSSRILPIDELSRREAIPDGEGRFDFGALAPGVYAVSARALEHTDAALPEVRVEAGTSTACELALATGVRLGVRVTDAKGDAIRDARLELAVQVERPDGRRAARTHRSPTRDGRFDLRGVAPGVTLLQARAKGFLEASRSLGELADGQVLEDVTLALDRGLAIEGTVRWPDGRPAVGARVTVRASEGDREPRTVHETRAGAGGSFAITGLERRSYDILADGLAAARPGSKKVRTWRSREERAKAPTAALELVFDVGATLSGRVVDDTGAAPLSFVVVAEQAAKRQYERPASVRELFRGSDGHFVLEGLGEGEWTVTARATHHEASTPQHLVVRGPIEDLLLVVPRAGPGASRAR